MEEFDDFGKGGGQNLNLGRIKQSIRGFAGTSEDSYIQVIF